MRILESKVNLLLDKEAKMWAQRSQIMWLKDGDCNTQYFHSKASQQRCRNYIRSLYDHTGRWCTWPTHITGTILKFYTDLFTSTNADSFEEVVEVIPRVVSDEMNDKLIRDFTMEEVETAFKQMAPMKALSPDGMPPLFYKTYWSLLGSDVSYSILHYLNTRVLPPSLGNSFITQIPKVKNIEYVHQFRPTSLSNVLYRIFSKVLANKLRDIMPLLISEHQSAFMSDRLIFDNILVAFVLHYMRNHTKGKTRFMALKLDISKAYDKVDWAYMEKVLEKMGFHERWVKLMMVCITTTSYFVLINGEPHGEITPTWGLHQGDPPLPLPFSHVHRGVAWLDK